MLYFLIGFIHDIHTYSLLSGYTSGMFVFFSSPLGCLGSIAVSILLTLVLRALFF